MHKLIHAGAGLKQRLDHQTILAFVPVRRLNQPLDFGAVQPLHRSFPGSRRFKAEPAAGLFDDVLRLVIPSSRDLEGFGRPITPPPVVTCAQ